jgi:hypothetical protein
MPERLRRFFVPPSDRHGIPATYSRADVQRFVQGSFGRCFGSRRVRLSEEVKSEDEMLEEERDRYETRERRVYINQRDKQGKESEGFYTFVDEYRTGGDGVGPVVIQSGRDAFFAFLSSLVPLAEEVQEECKTQESEESCKLQLS